MGNKVIRGSITPEQMMYQNMLKKLDYLEEMMNKESGEGGGGNGYSSFNFSKKSKVVSTSEADKKNQIAKILIDGKEIMRQYMSEGWENADGSPLQEARIKLIVTALNFKNSNSKLTDFAVKMTGIAKLGMVHTAVQIGPIILEWNDMSILEPSSTREWSSTSGNTSHKVLVALDMKTVPTKEFFQTYAAPLGDLIAEWNGKHFYNQLDSNCQKFSEQVLAVFGVKNVFTGKIGRFLDSVSTTDSKDLTFNHVFEGETRVYSFKTHKELDEICMEKSINGKLREGSEDFRLLKAYDRVFWLRYGRVMSSENMPPEMRKELTNRFKSADTCYFSDPSQTPTSYQHVSSKKVEEDEDTLTL